MKQSYNINSKASIEAFLLDLRKANLVYHPDDRFEDYIKLPTTERTFTDEEAATLNQVSENCLDYCRANGLDLCDLVVKSWEKETFQIPAQQQEWQTLTTQQALACGLVGEEDLDSPADQITDVLLYSQHGIQFFILHHASGKYSTQAERYSEYGTFEQCLTLLTEVF